MGRRAAHAMLCAAHCQQAQTISLEAVYSSGCTTLECVQGTVGLSRRQEHACMACGKPGVVMTALFDRCH